MNPVFHTSTLKYETGWVFVPVGLAFCLRGAWPTS
jgi:hypothetical protein